MSLFDPVTGEFNDSTQARVRARLMINFGNPYKDRRGDTIVPEKFSGQRPPTKRGISSPLTPQGSPPHDAFSSSVEGEGEAKFAGLSPPRVDETEVKRKHPDSPAIFTKDKRVKVDRGFDHKKEQESKNSQAVDAKRRPPPPTTARLGPNPSPPSKNTTMRLEENKVSPTASPAQRPPVPSRPLPPARRPPPPKPPNKQHVNIPSGKQHRPPAPAPKAKTSQPIMQNKQHIQHRPPPPAPSSQNPNAKPNIKLPDGWICVWSKSQKKWYYFDKKTNKSVWEWPPPGGIH